MIPQKLSWLVGSLQAFPVWRRISEGRWQVESLSAEAMSASLGTRYTLLLS